MNHEVCPHYQLKDSIKEQENSLNDMLVFQLLTEWDETNDNYLSLIEKL